METISLLRNVREVNTLNIRESLKNLEVLQMINVHAMKRFQLYNLIININYNI